MTDQCTLCQQRVNCDFLAGFCRLSPREIAQRPDLILSPDTLRKRDLAAKERGRYWAKREADQAPFRELDTKLRSYIADGSEGEWIDKFYRGCLAQLT